MGRHKTEISPEDMRKAEKYARKGHQNGTICELMGWELSWLEGREDIRRKLTKQRAWHKDDIRTDQERIRKADDKGLSAAATMAIFQGKNELGQSDNQKLTLEGGEVPLLVVIGRSTEKEQDNGPHRQG